MSLKLLNQIKVIGLGLVVMTGLISAGLATPLTAQAQPPGALVNCESRLPGTTAAPGSPPSCDFCTAIDLVNTVFSWAAYLLAGLSIIMILVAGFLYLTAAGSPARIEQAKKTLIFAIIGLVVVILAFVVVNTILTILVGQNTWFNNLQCSDQSLIPGATPGAGTTP